MCLQYLGAHTSNGNASVVDARAVHSSSVYKNSRSNAASISSFPNSRVRFGVDATDLETMFSSEDEKFDLIQFNFPHWGGKTNNRHNR